MTLADRRERERERRKEEIVGAAEKLFASRGYDDVSMNDIAAEAEVNKALLYYYFKDKEALYYAVSLRVLTSAYDLFKEYTSKGESGFEKLLLMDKAETDIVKKLPEYVLLQSSAPKIDVDFEDEYVKGVVRLFMDLICDISDMLQEGMEDGSIRRDIDPMETAILLSIISDGVKNLRPELKSILESRGIGYEQFVEDMSAFKRKILASPVAETGCSLKRSTPKKKSK